MKVIDTYLSPLPFVAAIFVTTPLDDRRLTDPSELSEQTNIEPSALHSTLSGLLIDRGSLEMVKELEEAENTPFVKTKPKSSS